MRRAILVPLAVVLLAARGTDRPSRASAPALQRLFGYVHAEYRDTRGTRLALVSQVIEYCVGPKSTNLTTTLKREAEDELGRMESEARLQVPAGAKREVSFDGGNSTSEQAEKSRAFWVKRPNAKTYETHLNGRTGNAADCKW